MYRQELSELSYALLRYEHEAINKNIKHMCNVPERLWLTMESMPPIKDLLGKMINFGNSARSLGVRDIAELLVVGSLRNGVDATVDSLIEYVAMDCTPTIQVLLLRGVKVEEAYELCDGVFIAKPEDVPSRALSEFLLEYPRKFDRDDFMDARTPFSDYQSDDPPDSVIFQLVDAKPKYYPMNPDLKQMEADAKSYSLVGKVSSLLPLMFPEISIRYSFYSAPLGDSFLEALAPSAWSSSGWSDIGVGCHEATNEDLKSFRDILSKYLKLTDSQRSKLDVPLHRLSEAARHHSAVDKAIDLGVALESLLLSDQPEQIQLSLQFRLRGAWLLGKDLESRKSVYQHLRDIYNYRSSAAHSGKLTKKVKDFDRARESLIGGLQLCADAIKAVIEEGEINWDDLLLGKVEA